MPTLETAIQQAYVTPMTLSRIGWLMSWLSVVALVLTVAMPQRTMAAPITEMAQTAHCANCPDDTSMPGKMADHHVKALPCGPSMCVGSIAAVLPPPGLIGQPIWRLASYAPSLLVGLHGRLLAPDPQPPRPSARA